ncbi:tyrosinase [Streptomyces sp. ISL-99]|uniref:tyrosinase cofactor n=1 Tax=Streptomyces sp. ISL-99 TaxID=2819193 RepID=UPI001BEB184D|nr:tyrosinase cofactor [Streptomyces sp. ISL-99]MBT2523974.1 tyrosinase [Streptomyces sp. ISL-99]
MDLITRRSATTVRGAFLTRRILLRGAFTVGVIAGTAGALTPILTKRLGAGTRPANGPQAAGAARAAAVVAGAADAAQERFAETYRGRHIQATTRAALPAKRACGSDRAGSDRAGAVGDAMTVTAVRDVEVRIDGRPLHIMRRADGSYLSLVNHYESFPTLIGAARAAVDELGDAQLSVAPQHSL